MYSSYRSAPPSAKRNRLSMTTGSSGFVARNAFMSDPAGFTAMTSTLRSVVSPSNGSRRRYLRRETVSHCGGDDHTDGSGDDGPGRAAARAAGCSARRADDGAAALVPALVLTRGRAARPRGAPGARVGDPVAAVP